MDPIYDAADLLGTASGEDGTPIYTFRITSPTVDRQGEVVTTDGWRFDAYLRNPVVLNSHDYTDIEAIVGRCVAINRDGDSWTADLRFNSTEYGCLAKELIDCGDLRAVSVGFRPIVIEYPDVPSLRAARTLTDAQEKALVNVAQDPGTAIRHVEKELLEISVVPVPANPDAIRLRSLAAMAAPVVAKAVAPGWMRSNARQGIAWYEAGKAGDGVTAQTVREAREMASGTVTADKAGRMAAWFARHMVDLDAPSAKPGHPDYPSPGVVAHALWGGGSRSESERAMAWAQAHSQERGMDTITAKGAIPYRKTPLAPSPNRGTGRAKRRRRPWTTSRSCARGSTPARRTSSRRTNSRITSLVATTRASGAASRSA
jgi:phage head maturation protease